MDTRGVDPADLGDSVDGALHGYWGFEPFDGPAFHLQTARAAPWRLAADDQQALVVGRDDTVHLEGSAAACVDSVTLQQPSGVTAPLDWKADGPEHLVATVPLATAEPGPMALLVRQYGMKDADTVPLHAFAEAGRLESFAFHAGDRAGTLKGTRLDEVAGLTLGGASFTPGELTSSGGDDLLSLAADGGSELDRLRPGQTLAAKVTLKDGRTVTLRTAVKGPRPRIALIGRSVQGVPSEGGAAIRLGDPDELARGVQLTLSVRVEPPTRLDGHESVEVAGADGAAVATLTPSSGLTQEDAQVLLATLDTGRALGASTFGPLQLRLVQDGAASDWQPIGALVRLPSLRELKCREAGRGCELVGDDLFLLDAVSSDPAFDHAARVPEGFPGHVLPVPHAAAGHLLYIRLHDDPKVVSEATFPPAHG